MDKIQEAASVIRDINKFRNKQLADHELIKSVCSYFDKIKNTRTTQADLHFLKHISSIVGIPHFYDLLAKFEKQIEIDSYDLNVISSILYESTLHTSEDNKVHKYQKNIMDRFKKGELNRYFLSASTSFGKTHIVFEIIKKMEYKNIVLIFPTIALLAENYEKILSEDNYSFFRDNYSLHTLSEVDKFAERNLFIYTPERFLSFMDKNESKIKFDFTFVDEIYKIDNDYLIDDEISENERDVAYRLAVFYALKDDVDSLLAGPYIDFSRPEDKNYNSSFDNFLRHNQIKLLDYNNYEIVNKSIKRIPDAPELIEFNFDEELVLKVHGQNKAQRLISITNSIISANENVIVYCARRGKIKGVEYYATKLIESRGQEFDTSLYADFIQHIERHFTSQWLVVRALKHGIGIHHGVIPKYIQKEIVSLFNNKDSPLKVLISTTTITEGVNTSAKNLVVLDNEKAEKRLKKFDAKNIAGRAGRFLYHYSGRVIVLENDFLETLNSPAEAIKHKNFDIDAPKGEVDLFYTSEEYLSSEDLSKAQGIQQQQYERQIPDFIFTQYKVVSRKDKIIVYDNIKRLTQEDHKNLNTLIYTINKHTNIHYDGFQCIIDSILPIVKSKKLLELINAKVHHEKKNKEYSLVTYLTRYYLADGFVGSMNYKRDKQGKSVDTAIRETAEFVYNILKYQVVKYVGVFNIMYKYYMSQNEMKPFEQVAGVDKLLVKLEYNALTEKGRLASDYGAPSKVVEHYENPNDKSIRAQFDKYEIEIFKKIESILKNGTTQ